MQEASSPATVHLERSNSCHTIQRNVFCILYLYDLLITWKKYNCYSPLANDVNPRLKGRRLHINWVSTKLKLIVQIVDKLLNMIAKFSIQSVIIFSCTPWNESLVINLVWLKLYVYNKLKCLKSYISETENKNTYKQYTIQVIH